MIELDRISKSWIFAQKLGADSPGYKNHSWAVDEVIELASRDPELLWLTILRILEIDQSDEVVQAVGAGPLEDLMVYHGESFLEKVREQAIKSATFRAAMRSVWLDESDTSVRQTFFQLAEEPERTKNRE